MATARTISAIESVLADPLFVYTSPMLFLRLRLIKHRSCEDDAKVRVALLEGFEDRNDLFLAGHVLNCAILKTADSFVIFGPQSKDAAFVLMLWPAFRGIQDADDDEAVGTGVEVRGYFLFHICCGFGLGLLRE